MDEKIKALSEEIDRVNSKVCSVDKCVSIIVLIGILSPVVLWLGLYFIQPWFVSKKEGNRYVRDKTKIVLYTLGTTLVIWIGLYVYARIKGYDKLTMLCSRK